MGASQVVLQREDLAAILRELKDIDPKAIAAMEEAKRKEAALTEEELAKLTKARSEISSYNSKMKEIKDKEEALLTEKSVHQTNVTALEDRVKSENDRLTEWENRLNLISQDHDAREQKQADEQKRVEEDNKKKSSELDERKSKLDAQEKTIKETDAAQKKEQDRLTEWAAKLKAKAARMAAEAEADE